jgi:hypothetical protein
MREVIIRCDICSAAGAQTIYLTVDRRMDGAGSMEDVQESADLCLKCAVSMVGFSCGNHDAANKIYEEIKSRSARAKIRKQEVRS